MNRKIDTEFEHYQISSEILEALTLLGYMEPTAVQREVIPAVLEGKNVVVKSQTGTGKTAAFAVPVCEMVSWDENLPQALVLEPTRELAVQVRDELFHIGRKKRLKVPVVFGGFPIDKQIQTLRQKSHIVVGTPGRVMDHIRRECLKLSKVSWLIIDEADLMLDMGFQEDVTEILSMLPKDLSILLFSATLDERVQQLAGTYIREPVLINQEPEAENAGRIEQMIYETKPEEKYQVFFNLLIQERPENCMIFCGTREMANVLFQKLRRDRIFCGMLHGEMDQGERLKTIEAFRRGRFRYLIATDVAARGIDFDGITHVINYDFPTGRETYVHRIGRTGRNGKSGRALSLVCENDQRMVRMVEEYTGLKLEVLSCPDKNSLDDRAFWDQQRIKQPLKARKGAALDRTIMRLSIGGGRKSKMRTVDIVGAICNIDGVEAEDIGIIDIRDSLTYVELLNEKGSMVLKALQEKPIKGKIRKVRKTGRTKSDLRTR